MNYSSEERVISDWTWLAYDDHGPWDEALGEEVPCFGWRRIIELRLGPVELQVTEWHFGPVHPAEVAAGEVRQVHAVRMPADLPRVA